MSNLSICVLCGDESEKDKAFPAAWFDLYYHEPDSIRQELKDFGADPHLAKIVGCRGFHDYVPKDIEEACDLSEEYEHLEDRSLWPLLLKRYQRPTPGLLGLTISDLERAFRGFYDEASSYVKEAAIENGDIDADSPLLPFISWFSFAESQMVKDRISAMYDPVSEKVAIFDTSDEAPSDNDSREAV